MARLFSLLWRIALALALAGGLPGGWAVSTGSAAPRAALSPEDQEALTTHLQIIARTSNPESAEIVNQILNKQYYTLEDWTGFFSGYFDQHPFTDRLYNYLTWPSFWNTPPATQWELQTAMAGIFQARIEAITAEHSENLGRDLAIDADLRQTLGNAHRWIMNITQNGRLYENQMRELFDFSIQYVEDYPQYWRKQRIDTAEQPAIAALAAQIHANLRELAWTDAAQGKQRVENALQLTGRYRDLWRSFTLPLYDNNRLGEMELNFLYTYFNALPAELRLTRGISVMDYLGNEDPHQVSLYLPGVNIFGIPIGVHYENGFPPDVPALPCDVFSLVVAHETNHSVNAQYIDQKEDLKTRHDALILSAGRDPLNYLRSMSEESFFVNNPQEFFAAIANQYFCSSEHTFRVGKERMRQGRPQPLDQALFFAEVYSTGSGQTYIYTSDPMARITRRAVPLYRDAWGQATGIDLPGGPLYVYRRDGLIAQVGSAPPVIEVSPPGGLEIRLPPDAEQTATLRVRNTGSLNAAVRFVFQKEGVATINGGALRVDDSPSLNFTKQITIEAWIKPRTWQDGHLNNGRVLQKGVADNQYRLTVENGGFLFDLFGVGSLSIPDWTPPLDTWTHVAGVYDGQKMRIYINGVKMAERTASGRLRVTSDRLFIGNKDDRLVDKFQGEMDEVRLWSVARTAAEIQRDSSRRIPPGTTGLAGYWNFDPQPEPAPVMDWSGRRNHAVLVGHVTVRYGLAAMEMRGEERQDLLPPGGETSREFTVSSLGLEPVRYDTMVTIESNDPQHPVQQIPIHVIISEPQPGEEGTTLYLPVIRR